MTTPPRKRYRRYLEPGQPRQIPRQTVHNQRSKQREQDGRADDCGSSTTNGEQQQQTQASSSAQGCSVEASVGAPDGSGAAYDAEDTGPGSDGDASEGCEQPAEECSDLDDEDVRSYLEQCSNETLPNHAISKAQALLLILSYVVYAGLSWSQVEGLLKLINTLCGCTVVPDSKFLFRKLWKDRMKSIGIHFYCKTCFTYLGAKNPDRSEDRYCSVCQTSSADQQLMKKGSFFLIFDLRRQLYDVIARHVHHLFEKLRNAASPVGGVYSDITNGRMYLSIRRQLKMKWSDITVTLNTDGAPVFKSARASVWPILMMTNELEFNIRFPEVFIGALWFAKEKPPVGLFLKTFVEVFNRIGAVVWEHDGSAVASRVFVTCCCVDSPARAQVLNMKKYNAYYSCPWCLEKGTRDHSTIRYIPSRQAAPLRTHKSMVRDMVEALNSPLPAVHGMRGPSPLMKLKGFNMVCCMPPDMMHCVLEGVAEQLLDSWLTATGTTWYIGREEKVLDKRIVSLKPPNTFCRLPRPVTERAQWKASEWFYWLLFYSLPCLKDILPIVYLTHFTLLCQGVFLLMQESVDDRDVLEAGKLLTCFVTRMYTLYGPSAATYNVHQLVHLAKSVEMVGPLWGTSCFPFESANGELLKHVKAAQGVPLQIAERCVMKSWLATAERFITLTAFLEGRKNRIVNARKFSLEEVRVLGAPLLSMRVDSLVQQLFIAKYGLLPSMTFYSRACLKGINFHTTTYARVEKTYTSCVKMNDEKYCLVTHICSALFDVRVVLLICEELVVSESGFPHVKYIHKCYRPPPGKNISLYSYSDVSAVCCYLEEGGICYVSDIPHNFRID